MARVLTSRRGMLPQLGSPNRKHWSRKWRVRLPIVLCLAGALCVQSGCTSVNSSVHSIFSSGCLSDAIEKHRNRTCALKAWYRREHNFCNQAYLRDFKKGFVAGYMAIADGKPGCPPNLPPKDYWGWAYQTGEGRAQLAAWFAGYPYGVQAAKDDGLGDLNHIQLGEKFKPYRPYGTLDTAASAYGSGQANPYYGGPVPYSSEPLNYDPATGLIPQSGIPLNDASILQQVPGAALGSGLIEQGISSPFPGE